MAEVGCSEQAVKEKNPEDRMSYLIHFFEPIREYLNDDDVSEIMINGSEQIYIEKRGRVVGVRETFISEQALRAAVQNVARRIGRSFDAKHPRLDARLPDGSRVHAVLPPLSRQGTIVAIRKFSKNKLSVEDLIHTGSISAQGAELLELVVRLKKNVMVSGATSSGKTSVLNILSRLIPDHERILVLEDASELQLQQTHTVYFETRNPDENGRGAVTIRDLLHSSLRLRPDRLVIGEIRGGEALDLLQALNTGHGGSMSTIHANSPADALSRLETCVLISGVELPLQALRAQIASAIQVLVHTARSSDGARRITHISEVRGLEDGVYRIEDILVYKEFLEAEETDCRHALLGRPQIYEEARRTGVRLEKNPCT